MYNTTMSCTGTPAHIIGVIEFMQPYKKLISYKKPSYVAEFGIGNEVGHSIASKPFYNSSHHYQYIATNS